eukprot:SAG31_NODE_2057_length_6542_cov_2.889182_2_plen_78_part_00
MRATSRETSFRHELLLPPPSRFSSIARARANNTTRGINPVTHAIQSKLVQLPDTSRNLVTLRIPKLSALILYYRSSS